MTNRVPTAEHASGMLKAIKSTHTCGEACTSRTRLGDGTYLQLSCPWGRLNPAVEADRRIIQSVYASEAVAAMRR